MKLKEKINDVVKKNSDAIFLLKVAGGAVGLVGIGYLIGHASAVRHINGLTHVMKIVDEAGNAVKEIPM